MKYTYIIIAFSCCLCLAFNKVSQAQFIKAVSPIGLNFTQVDGDEIAGYNKVGLHTGIGAMIDLNEGDTWEIGFEILYSKMGSKSNTTQAIDMLFDLKLQYDYVSVPLLVNYKDVGKGYLGAGLVISRLVNNKRFVDKIEVPDVSIKSMDFGIMGQAGFVFSPNFRVTLRAAYSALPFYSEPRFSHNEPRYFHNYVTLRFDTILNGLIKL